MCGQRLCVTVLTLAILACGVRSASAQKSATNAAAGLNWVSYTDTAEGAFSMDVPVGWQVLGGMYCFGYFDVRWMMDVRSLDGKVVIRIDDVNVPPYVLPGPHTGRDGEPYAKPQQFQMTVSTFRSGGAYAESYAKKRFASVCKTLTARSPNWNPTIPSAWQSAPNSQPSEGSVAYDCASSEGPRVAMVYARPTLFPSTGLWVVDPIISVVATPDQAALAYSMVQRMIDSWRENPQWKQYQDRMTQIGLQQVQAAFGQFMQQMQAYDRARTAAMNQQVAGFEAHQNAQARQVSEWGEILTGVQSVRDPQTGNEFQVFTGPKANYYMNGNGVKVNSNISPGPDFHQLTPVQP